MVTENFEPTSTPSTFKCSPDVRPKILKPDTAAGDCGQTDRPIKLMPIPALVRLIEFAKLMYQYQGV